MSSLKSATTSAEFADLATSATTSVEFAGFPELARPLCGRCCHCRLSLGRLFEGVVVEVVVLVLLVSMVAIGLVLVVGGESITCHNQPTSSHIGARFADVRADIDRRSACP